MPMVDKSGKRVRQMFGEIADRYDLLNHLLSLNVDRYWRWRTVRSAPPRRQGPILDVCTGTADLAFAYYRSTRGTLPIIAADFSHRMLTNATAKAHRLGCGEHLRFIEADAQLLPFPNNSFQLVTVAFGLRNVSDTDQGLREMARVCQPQGRVAILEFSMPSQRLFGQLYRFYFRHVLPRIGQALARNRSQAYNYLPASVEEFPSPQRLAERMRAAGLSSVEFLPLTFGVATLYIGTK